MMPWRAKIIEIFKASGRIPKGAVPVAFLTGLIVAGLGVWMYVRQSFDAELTEWAVFYTAVILAFALALMRSASKNKEDKDD